MHTLIDKLVSQKVRPAELPTIVAALFEGRLWTVYGNRRIYALREYAKRFIEAGRVPDQIKVIVHPAPFKHLDEQTHRRFLVKFVLACSTSNDGQQAYCR